MATMTRAEMIDWILEDLGVKAASQSADSHRARTAGRVLDSVHDRLSREGLAPFLLSAVPEWAQQPLADVVEAELLKPFRIGGEMAQLVMEARAQGRRELATQSQGKNHQLPTKVEPF